MRIVDISIALALEAGPSDATLFFRADTCSLLDWVMISVTCVIAAFLVASSMWLFNLGVTRARLTRIRMVVTIAAAVLAGLGIVFGTASIMRWVDCYLLLLGDAFIN
ncbi:MAG: hypothetical protein F4X44_12770 [Gammaproteobacteria bacterium]|nr:hypothetical protein [Gammaproteobacteria bacterium]MYD81469.1 hypothetical protein [Gammaproteobacteria bacterium]